MAVVVQQTAPFTNAALRIDDASRWQKLLPLLRPSCVQTTTADGLRLVLNGNHKNRDGPIVVAVPEPGRLSTELLDNDATTAVLVGVHKGETFDTKDLLKALAGYSLKNGVVIVQLGSEYRVLADDQDLIYIHCADSITFDHLLRLTCSARSLQSHKQVSELLNTFGSQARRVIAEIAAEKADGSIAITSASQTRALTSLEDAILHDLDRLVPKDAAPSPQTTWSIHFADINGLSRLEIYIAVAEIGKYFERRKLPFRVSQSSINSSNADARGYAISLCTVSSTLLPPQSSSKVHDQRPQLTSKVSTNQHAQAKMHFVDAEVRSRVVRGCEAVIGAEKTITEYDTIVGDGDCGYTLRDGAKQVLQFISDRDLSNLPAVLDALVQELEISMGGTSGALYCIFLTALASSLAEESTVPKALHSALEELMKYTRARLGDRTMMDALIPFVQTLNSDADAAQAIAAAEKGVEGTKQMEAKLGRSTYLDESATQGVPDPGAYGLLVLLEGMTQ